MSDSEGAKAVVIQTHRKKQSLTLFDLSDLINDGILVVKEYQHMMVRDEITGNVSYSAGIQLDLRDKEIFEQLKKERDEALDKLAAIRDILINQRQ